MKAEALRQLITEAVQRTVSSLRGNPLVCLSGGIDSSTVASLAPDLPVITGWYDHPGCDERQYAALVAGEREWHQVQIHPQDFIDCFEDTAFALDGLQCGPGAVGQYVVARYAADEGFDTLVTGEGGDELFGGYARQYIVAGLDPPDGYEDYELPDGYPTDLAAALDLEWAALRTLCSVDARVAGAHGLDVVTPLLDPWVVAWVFQQPVRTRAGKKLIRDAMRGVVSDLILDRKGKCGFPVPFVAWAQEKPLKPFVKDRIGYVPDPAKPWDRQWWYDLIAATSFEEAAA